MKSIRKIAIMHCKYKFLIWMEGNTREILFLRCTYPRSLFGIRKEGMGKRRYKTSDGAWTEVLQIQLLIHM